VRRSSIVGAEGRRKVDLKRSGVREGRPVSWSERRRGKEVGRDGNQDQVDSESVQDSRKHQRNHLAEVR